MRKTKVLLATVALTLTLFACGTKEKKATEEFNVNESTEVKPVVDALSQGELLIKASDCKTCHHPLNKIIGPAHTDVAKKYEFTEANVKMLAKKIISGGQGNWGEIPMAAHADISTENAESMARYILGLDGEKEH